MKLVEIKHYVPKSFEGKPSFVLLMSDNKEYISNGCVFVKNTQENVDGLIVVYDCQHWLDELFQSDGCDMSSVVNASFMFYNCKSLRTFDGDMSSVTDAQYMFYGCKSLKTFSGDMKSVVNASFMFYGCKSLETFDGDMSSVVDASCMFIRCKSLKTFDGDMSSVVDATGMFYGCESVNKK